MSSLGLPLASTPCERADAARNRQRILAAAGRLFARDGVACTSMDAIAAEAGVGKGTLFRRFGDRASLALALLDASSSAFQENFIRGPAPLGPGALPCERLIAFGHGLLEHVADNGDLILASERPSISGGRLHAGPYAAYRTHVMLLIAEAAPDLDADYLADVLLAPLTAELVLHQLKERQMPLERLAGGWEKMVHRLLNAGVRVDDP